MPQKHLHESTSGMGFWGVASGKQHTLPFEAAYSGYFNAYFKQITMIPILPSGSQPQRKRKGFLTASLLALGLALPSGSAEGFAHAEKMKFGVVRAVNVTAPRSKPGDLIVGVEVRWDGFFEWKFADWFGLRTGLGYASADVVAAQVAMTGQAPTLLNLDLHRMTVPLVARFYPGAERKFCLYLGPRFGGIVSGKQVNLINVSDRAPVASCEDVFDLAQIGFQRGRCACPAPTDLASATRKQYPSTTLDFGFEYATRWGLTLGMEGLGFSLGYDFSSLFQDSPAEAAVVQAG